MKVYVVTSGSYSDYRIDAIFSTEHKAEIYSIVKHGNGVDEWEVDGDEIENDGAHEIKDVYHCSISQHNGEFIHQYKGQPVWAKKTDRVKDLAKYNIHNQSFGVDSYVSQEHANKLAVEVRQEWLRSQL